MKTNTMLLIVCSLYSGENWAHDHGSFHRGYGGFHGSHGRFHGGHGGFYGRSGFGLYFNAPIYSYRPLFYPHSYYYPYPFPYYPSTVLTVPATPPIYIQQSLPADQPPAAPQYPSGYWYYCSNPEGYYPDVKECPQGWLQVKPIPPTPR